MGRSRTIPQLSTLNPQPAHSVFHRFLLFNAICGIGIGLAVLLLHLFHTWLGWNLYLSNMLGIILVTCWNFGMNARFNWPRVRRKFDSAFAWTTSTSAGQSKRRVFNQDRDGDPLAGLAGWSFGKSAAQGADGGGERASVVPDGHAALSPPQDRRHPVVASQQPCIAPPELCDEPLSGHDCWPSACSREVSSINTWSRRRHNNQQENRRNDKF
jgi:hypothetical protein